MQPDTTLPKTPAIQSIIGTIDAPLEAGANPQFNFLINTIGEITWLKTGTGVFEGITAGKWKTGRTVIQQGGNGGGVSIPISYSTPLDFAYNITRYNDNMILLTFFNTSTWDNVDPYDILSSGQGNGVPITIQIIN